MTQKQIIQEEDAIPFAFKGFVFDGRISRISKYSALVFFPSIILFSGLLCLFAYTNGDAFSAYIICAFICMLFSLLLLCRYLTTNRIATLRFTCRDSSLTNICSLGKRICY